MLAWFAANWGTLLVCLILLGIVAFIVMQLRKDKKKGKSSCGGNCAHCGMCNSCHKK